VNIEAFNVGTQCSINLDELAKLSSELLANKNKDVQPFIVNVCIFYSPNDVIFSTEHKVKHLSLTGGMRIDCKNIECLLSEMKEAQIIYRQIKSYMALRFKKLIK
jgi:hypothetical protein